MKNIKINLGLKIEELRNQHHYTQERLSALSGIDYKYIQKIERNDPPALKIDTIEKIAKALNTTPSKLLEF